MSGIIFATDKNTTYPLGGALAWDPADPSSLYVGNGAAFVNVSTTDPNAVTNSGAGVNNDIAVFDGATGKIIKDSGILYTNVVTGPVSAVSGNLASFNGTGGKIIQDSGISTISSSQTGVTFTSDTASPSLPNCTLQTQKITIGSVSMITLNIIINQTINVNPSLTTWTADTALPVGYRPSATIYFPIVIQRTASPPFNQFNTYGQLTNAGILSLYYSSSTGNQIFGTFGIIYNLV
jgi:hypothetical protein